MKFKKLLFGRALYIQENKIWVARGLTFFAVDFNGKRLTKKIKVGNIIERIIAAFRLPRQLLRIGIHNILPFNNGDILVSLKKKIQILDEDGKIKISFTGYSGNKPAQRGICIAPNGYIFLGEYSLNNKRQNDTKLYRSTDNGKTFECIFTLPKNKVRHIHFVQWDTFENCLWLGTGDEDHECLLMRSKDYGITWEKVGGGSQLWRAISVVFTKDTIYWGTDAGSVPDKNYFVKMDRQTKETSRLFKMEGPCHGSTMLADGTIYVSTGVEGGENEHDSFAYLKAVQNEKPFNIMKLKKDILPLILQYGVMRFPPIAEGLSASKLIFTCYGLKKYGEVVLTNE